MKFDFKVNTWERVMVPEKYEEKILQAIKSGVITSSQGIYDFLGDENESDITHIDLLNGYVEQITVDKNDGYNTIEVLTDTENIYGNGKSW